VPEDGKASETLAPDWLKARPAKHGRIGDSEDPHGEHGIMVHDLTDRLVNGADDLAFTADVMPVQLRQARRIDDAAD
jgi:hypothetical protein